MSEASRTPTAVSSKAGYTLLLSFHLNECIETGSNWIARRSDGALMPRSVVRALDICRRVRTCYADDVGRCRLARTGGG
jgi:hypothetical protein